jgi:hypothetical protein
MVRTSPRFLVHLPSHSGGRDSHLGLRQQMQSLKAYVKAWLIAELLEITEQRILDTKE